MERIAGGLKRDLIKVNPDCTVEDFIYEYEKRCTQEVEKRYEQCFSVLTEEFAEQLLRIIDNIK